MGIKKTFIDNHENEMQILATDNGQLQLEIWNEHYREQPSYIKLDIDDVEELILALTDGLNKIARKNNE
ncbi:MAG: hypothetical protein AAF575_00020 [Bacteroidota bacterium]